MVGGPVAGRKAVLKIGGTTVGKLRNVTIETAVALIKDYSMETVHPEVFEPGNETYTFRAGKLMVDSPNIWLNSVLSQSSPSGIDIEVYPHGTGAGEVFYVLGDALFTRWREASGMDAGALEDLEGEGMTLTVDSVAAP